MADAGEVKHAVLEDKKTLVAWQTNHKLHVLMIMKQNGLTKTQAEVQAYFEGVNGLNKRLA